MARNNAVTQAHMNFNDQMFKQWLNERDIAVDYYNGNTDRYTKEWLTNNIIKNVPISNNNITKRIIDRISLVYTEDVIREASNDRYNEFIPNKDSQLLLAERKLNLLNMVPIVMSWRDGVIEYDVLDTFVPEFLDDPLKPVGISYPVSNESSVDNVDGQLWIRLTADEIIYFDNEEGNIKSREENPFGVLPVVFAFTEKPSINFLSVDPVNDLIQSNLSINVLSTDMSANIRFQSFGIPYATGFNEDTSLQILIGPDKLTLLPADSNVGILSPPDTVTSVTDGLKYNYSSISQNYHLPASFVEGTTAESGVSLRLRNVELMDERKSSVKLWRKLETQIFEVERAIINVAGGINLSEDFSVDFGEHMMILSPSEQREQDDYDLEHNFVTDAQLLMKSDPDRFVTEEEAQAFIDDNRKKNARNESASLADLLVAPVEEV